MTAGPANVLVSEPAFAHTAVIVDSEHVMRAVLVPHLRRSLQAGQPVVMVVGEHITSVVRDELGTDPAGLEWADPTRFYQRLGFAYEQFRRYLAAQHAAGRRVHVVAEPEIMGEVDADASTDRAAAYLAYESVCNETYAPYGSPVTCVWDSRRHAAEVIEGARSVHSHELTAAGRRRNPAYVRTDDFLAGRANAPFDEPPAAVDHDLTLVDATQLSSLRAVLLSWVGEHSFGSLAGEDVVLATTEVATNGLTHGSAPIRVRGWRQGSVLVTQVDDRGGRPLPPDAGYRPPAAVHTPGGRGLWLARQLADTVTTYTSNGRTSVRLHFPREIINRLTDATPS